MIGGRRAKKNSSGSKSNCRERERERETERRKEKWMGVNTKINHATVVMSGRANCL